MYAMLFFFRPEKPKLALLEKLYVKATQGLFFWQSLRVSRRLLDFAANLISKDESPFAPHRNLQSCGLLDGSGE